MEEEEIQGEAGEGGYKKWLKLNAQQKLELMRERVILQHYCRTIISGPIVYFIKGKYLSRHILIKSAAKVLTQQFLKKMFN